MNGAVDLPLGQAELSFTAAGEARVRRSVLPSGVRVLSEQVPGSRSVTVGFWVAVGSRDEQRAEVAHPATYGSTHFLEHLLFKGTTNRSALDIAISFDAVGGEHNALTAKEYTCYYAKVQDRDLPMAVEVLADMFTSSLLDPVEFDNERGVILEELSMAGDDPGDVANERFFEAVLGEHPLGRPIGGSPDTIRAATREAVWEHYRANYRPQDLVVTVAGAVDHDELVTGLQSRPDRARLGPHGRRSTGRPPQHRARDLLAPGAALTVVAAPDRAGQPPAGRAGPRRHRRAPLDHERAQRDLRLGHVVAPVPAGPRARGLAYAVYSFAPGYSDAGLVRHVRRCCAPAKAATVAALMRTELERVAEHGVTDDELRRAAVSSAAHRRSPSRTPTPGCPASAVPSSRSASSSTSTRHSVASPSSPQTTCERSRRTSPPGRSRWSRSAPLDEAALRGAVDEIAPTTGVA